MLALISLAAAFTLPTPHAAAAARARSPVMSLDYNSLLLADGINGGIKAAAASALGPELSNAAPYIGTAIFVGIFAVQSGVFSGNKDNDAKPVWPVAPEERVVKEAPPAPAAEEAPPAEAAEEPPAAE